MSKISNERGGREEDREAPIEDAEYLETRPLRVLSNDSFEDDIELFAESHSLTAELDSLSKAASLLQGEVSALSNAEQTAIERQSTHKWHQSRTLYFTILVCALGAIEQGMGQTGINGANLYLPKALNIDSGSARDSFILGLINCGLYLANALLGSWLAQPVNDRLGRRGAIFIGTILCMVGNLLSAVSWSWPVLLFARCVLGTGLGLNGSTVAVFAAESAPAYIRGGLAVSWQLFTAFGICVSFIANVAFYDQSPDVTWRLQLGAPVVPTIPLLVLIYLCPESPTWWMKRGRYDFAFASLARLRNTKVQAASDLYSDYLTRRANEKLSSGTPKTFLTKLASLFTIPRNCHAVYASYTVMLTQQLCGINIISFYSSTIFSSSGFSTHQALWASVIFGAVNFLGAAPAIWSMDAFGRRWLLLWTLPFMALTMGLSSLTFGLPEGNVQLVLLAALIYVFCALYSPGAGPVPVAYSAEVFPAAVREVGMSFAVSTANIWATALSVTFPLLLNGLGEQGAFALYAVLNVVAWALCWTFVRETKGVELEKMDQVFEASAAEYIIEQWYAGVGGRLRKRRQREGWTEVSQDGHEDS